jgi:transcriptional regulator with XRE-family HTH domain
MTKLPPSTALARRLGTVLQEQRHQERLTQAELGERADLSLKYVGEIERGEANVTVQALERLANALHWDPWSLFAPEQQAISEGAHHVLVAQVGDARDRLQTILDWLTALTPARRQVAEAERVTKSARRQRPPSTVGAASHRHQSGGGR